MPFWLFKQEPDCYSYADLERDGETLWDGITNALALKHLRTAQAGDQAFFYHTGDEKAVVGIMEVTGAPRPDPKLENEKLVVVPVKPVGRLASPVTLAMLKADPAFADWELIRISRLSVMPCSPDRWERIVAMAEGKPVSETGVKKAITKKK